MNAAAVRLGAALAVLVAVWWHGHHVGTQGIQAKWDAQKLADQQAAETQRETERLRAQSASRDFEAKRMSLRAQAEAARAGLRRDLQQPFHCPEGGDHVQTLADLPVPAAAVDRLRSAAGQGSSPR